MLSKGERFVAIPPTKTSMWCVSIRNALGEFREPTADEIDELMKGSAKLMAALARAAGTLRAFAAMYPEHEDDVAEECRAIVELLG